MTSWEEAALSRSKELMGFTNPAIVDLVSVLDAHAPTGWLKTYALNDACMFSVLFSQMKDWQKEDQENEVTVLRQMKQSGADASILQGIEDARRRKESGDASLLIFYQNACSNHFATHYGMTGADFIDKLKNVYYGQPRPVFGSN